MENYKRGDDVRRIVETKEKIALLGALKADEELNNAIDWERTELNRDDISPNVIYFKKPNISQVRKVNKISKNLEIPIEFPALEAFVNLGALVYKVGDSIGH